MESLSSNPGLQPLVVTFWRQKNPGVRGLERGTGTPLLHRAPHTHHNCRSDSVPRYRSWVRPPRAASSSHLGSCLLPSQAMWSGPRQPHPAADGLSLVGIRPPPPPQPRPDYPQTRPRPRHCPWPGRRGVPPDGRVATPPITTAASGTDTPPPTPARHLEGRATPLQRPPRFCVCPVAVWPPSRLPPSGLAAAGVPGGGGGVWGRSVARGGRRRAWPDSPPPPPLPFACACARARAGRGGGEGPSTRLVPAVTATATAARAASRGGRRRRGPPPPHHYGLAMATRLRGPPLPPPTTAVVPPHPAATTGRS